MSAQFGCGSAVVLTNGYTATGVTTPGNAGPEDWNDNPTDTAPTSEFYWDDDVYTYTYTAGSNAEEVSMTIFSVNSWNGIGIFTNCSGTVLSGHLTSVGLTGANTSKTVTANIAANQTIYIAVGQWGAPNGLNFNVTSFTAIPLINPPSCVSLSTPANMAVGVSSPIISWPAAAGGATDYVLKVGTTSGGTDILNNISVGNVLTYNLGSLDLATTYYVTVTPSNSNGVATGPCPESSFSTCSEVTEYVENFEAYPSSTTSLPNCWSRGGTSTSTYITTGSTAPMSPTKRIYMFASGTTPTEGYLILPAVSNLQLNTHRLKFKAFSSSGTDRFLEVGYLTNPSDVSTFISLTEISIPGPAVTNTQEMTIIPTGIPAGVKNLAVRNPGYPNGSTTAYLDDFKWEAIPSCQEPLSSTAINVTATTAQLSWVEGGSATAWNIEYGITGFAQGSGTLVNGVTTNPYSIVTLPATSYSYYVQADCGATNGVSVWVGPYTFTTPCLPYTIPYFEGFESGYTHNVAVSGCLSQQSITSTGVWTANNTLTTYNRAPRTGSWNAFLQYGNEDWLFIPIELVGGTSYTVDLFARQDGATAANSNMLISYGNSPSATAMTNAIVPATGIINGGYQQITGAFTPSTNGVYYVGIKGFMNSSPWYISLDDIKIDVTPTCPAPNTLTVSNLTSTSANLSWVGTTGNYEYVLDNNIADPTGSGTATTLSTFNATTLTPSTTYYFHVRSSCGSTWSRISFTTLASPPSNDNCGNATVLTVNPNYSCGTVTAGTVAGATDSGLTNSTCFGTEDDDVWFSFVATSTTHRISLTNVAGSVTDMYHVIYNGVGGCGSLGASLLCSDADVSNPSGLIVGNTYFVQVYTYTSTPNQNSTFNICVGTPPTCYEPTALSAVFVAPTSANLSWSAPTLGNSPVGYNWEIVPQGNGQGNGVVASGNTATTTAVATGLTASTLYDLYVQTNCGGTDQSSWVALTFITDYCLPVGTSALTYINNFSTTLGTTNITNNASGFSAANYGNFTSLSTSLGATQSFNFNVEIVGGTVGCAIWIDWGNDFTFNSSDLVYSTTSYGAGPFTGSITVPAATPSGTYRMRIMTDYLDSNPGDDSACGFASGRGEVEDYLVIVDNTLQSENFINSNFVAYPNPVKDVLNLSYSSEITSVKVINLLGQEVISKKVNNTTSQIDMTNLSAGAYIVNITVDDVVKTIKVIKQ